MSFTITHRDVSMNGGDDSSVDELLMELDEELDEEHPDVVVTDQGTGWGLGILTTAYLPDH